MSAEDIQDASSPLLRWHLARRTLTLGARTLVMGILNVTPDSFSDGGRYAGVERAVARAMELRDEGADIIDIGGESTRPGAVAINAEEEGRRIVPVIERLIAADFSLPLSLDTTKAAIARAGLSAGAEIINDISALRFDPQIADEVARAHAGLVLMHSRGTSENLHKLEPVPDIFSEVMMSLERSIGIAEARGVSSQAIALDPGIGFGKSQAQNLLLLARLNDLTARFPSMPFLVGASRKSFIGKITDAPSPDDRLHGTMASVVAAILGGAHIVRVHDVAAAVETARMAFAIRHAKTHAR